MRDPDTGVIKRVTDVVKRERPTPSSFPDDDLPDTTKLAAFYYADLYGLPGASYLLSYAEVQYLEQVMASVASEQSKITPTLAYNTPQPGGPLGMDKRFLERAPVTLAELADAPHDCPPFIKAAMGAKWTTLDDWNEEDDTTFDSMFPHFAKHNCIVKGEYGLFYKNLVAGLPEGPARERFTFNPRISSGRRNRRLEYDEMDPYDEEFYRDYPEYYDEYPRRKRLKSPPPKNSPMINAKIPPMMMSSGTGPSQKMEVFSDNLYGFGNTRDQLMKLITPAPPLLRIVLRNMVSTWRQDVVNDIGANVASSQTPTRIEGETQTLGKKSPFSVAHPRRTNDVTRALSVSHSRWQTGIILLLALNCTCAFSAHGAHHVIVERDVPMVCRLSLINNRSAAKFLPDRKPTGFL
jgi:hypothetical protein